ncbi:large ribosomal subunit protein uL10m-like [Musca vetustissima]|uniref:large ribosomal subunit protein uL10m-like n=1 Tax=Musca vetustissima TaxID=27455 RepID=UPI002AB6C90C|nr:large ribosomal subunit protein uL10m-like [Musca vetustissima]
MSQLIKPELFHQLKRSNPLLQFQRFRAKINIQRPRQPHYERARVIAVTTPQYPEPPKVSNCFEKKSRTVQENPYNDIIAREVYNWLSNSKMVGIFHINSIKSDDYFDARVLLHKQNMQLKQYGQKIVRKAVEGNRFEAILPLFDAQTCLVFSPEPKVAQLLKITRKIPQMLLIAGIVDDTLLSRNEFMQYAQLPGLKSAQAELVQTLNMAGTSLVQNLEAHQKNFVNILDVYAKSESSDGGDASKTTAPADSEENKN